MAAPWSCAVTPSWGPSKSSWSSNSSSICRRNHHHASPRQQRRFPSHPTPCSGDFRDASVDIAHFFTPVEKVGLGRTKKFAVRATRSRPRRHALPRPSPAGGYVERAYLSREAFVMFGEVDSVVRVCSQSEVAPGSVKAFAVGDKTLAVYNIDGTFYATDDECTHAAASLADGMIDGDVIECCMHMGSFHVPSGKVVEPPCEVPLRTYQVVLGDEDVFADLGRNAAGEPE